MHSTAPTAQTRTARIPIRERLLGWKEILETANPPVSRPLDTVGKWLVITRAAVFPMTIWSGLIGGLLAVEANRVGGGAPVDWGLFSVSRTRRSAAGPREGLAAVVRRLRVRPHAPRGWPPHARPVAERAASDQAAAALAVGGLRPRGPGRMV
jgi:hypothetical protein